MKQSEKIKYNETEERQCSYCNLVSPAYTFIPGLFVHTSCYKLIYTVEPYKKVRYKKGLNEVEINRLCVQTIKMSRAL